jgi:DNA-binding NarL/FixJ family response regulator
VSDIAAQLNLSVKTVSTHKARLMEKMGPPIKPAVHYAITSAGRRLGHT